MRYLYCPQCGEKLIEKEAGDDGLVPFCSSCSRFWFDGMANCVIVLVANNQGEIALLKQPHLSEKYASFVSGYISPGENAEECALREVKEELGIDLDRLEYGGTHWFDGQDMLMHGFIGYTEKKDFNLSEEISSAQWVDAKKAVKMMFPETPGNAMYPLYRQYLRRNQLSKL